MRGFGELGVLFLRGLGDKEPGRGQEIVYSGEHTEEQEEYREQQESAVHRSSEKYQGYHYEVDSGKKDGDSAV